VSFDAPWLLLSLVVVVAAAVGYVVVQRRPTRYAVTYSNLDVLASVGTTGRSWRRHLPAVLLLGALATLCIAVARPTWPFLRPSERATVILVVDVSGSMRAADVAPTRLAAAQSAMQSFLDKAPDQLKVGIIAFSDDAQVVVPPTRDREQLSRGIGLLAPGFGTAIGDAIGRAVDLARTTTSAEGERASAPLKDAKGRSLASILLLSDGSQTRGVLTPGQGADLAKKAGIPVFTIALGTDAGTIIVGPPGGRQIVPVAPDRETLAAIAQYTEGDAYDAETAKALDRVYSGLGSRVGREEVRREISAAFVALGAVLAAGALVAGALVAPRLP
jgi:Ca-activated chloride channel family protein